MLEVKDIFVSYGPIRVLRGVSLNIQLHEAVCIIGPNGAGKSTLVKSIMNLIQVESGEISLNGENLLALPTQDIVEMGITLVPEGRRVFANMSVRENLLLGSYIKKAKQTLDQNLNLVQELFPILKVRFEQKAGTLSGGEQQMLAIARGLMSDPNVIILDEPSLGLARLLVEEIFSLINNIKEQGMTVLLVEQDVLQSLRLSDRGYVLEKGEVCLGGKTKDLIEDEHIKKAYLGL